MKVVIGGSFNVYDEMKNLAKKLEEIGIDVILPKHSKGMEDVSSLRKHKQDVINGRVELNEEDYKKIGNVESWFFKQIKEADCVIIYNKNIKGEKVMEGYIGINASTDMGYALGSNKEVILVYPPIDVGIRGLCSVGLLKIMDVDELVKYMKERIRK